MKNRRTSSALTTRGDGDLIRNANSQEPLLLRPGEVARALGMGRSKVYEMAQTGELPVVKIGTAVRIPRLALLAWIELHTLNGTSEQS